MARRGLAAGRALMSWTLAAGRFAMLSVPKCCHIFIRVVCLAVFPSTVRLGKTA